MPDFFDEGRPHDGLRYDAYQEAWTRRLDEPPSDDADPDARRLHHYLKYNWERQARVHDSYSPSEALRSAAEAIQDAQLWMVLTEPWCGDSAFVLPVIAEAASLSDQVALRILPRDDNLDIMDQYLTDGSRSIPKLVAFTKDGEELFTWGPRPDGAARRFSELQAKHDEKMDLIEEFLEYYEEGGWTETDRELAERIQAVTERSVSGATGEADLTR